MHSQSLDLRNGKELEGVLGLKMTGQKIGLKRCIHLFGKVRYLTASCKKCVFDYFLSPLYIYEIIHYFYLKKY